MQTPQIPLKEQAALLLQSVHGGNVPAMKGAATHQPGMPTPGGASAISTAPSTAAESAAAVGKSANATRKQKVLMETVPDFDWTLYLKQSRCKAAPHSAFKHVSTEPTVLLELL